LQEVTPQCRTFVKQYLQRVAAAQNKHT